MKNNILVQRKVIVYQNRSLTFAFAAVLALGLFRPALAEHIRHYTVTDLGTLGGTLSSTGGMNNKGEVEGFSTLPGDQIQRAFLWRDGLMTDLGTLGGPNSFAGSRPSQKGQVGGSADTATLDPLGENFCGFGTPLKCLPFVWQNGGITPLPTLGGNNGIATGFNDEGQVVGFAENTTSDATCPPPQQLQFRPVIWERYENEEDNQALEHRRWDVSELPLFPGDLEGMAVAINNHGNVIGNSGNCTDQTLHALLWRNGTVTDLGNLGGTTGNFTQDINNRGQVVGGSNLPGGTTFHGFLWQRGVMTDLGTLPGDVASDAVGINDKGQVVGRSLDASFNRRAFIWQDGVMTDLNTLIPAGSPLFLRAGISINSSGQITGNALQISTGEIHAYLATPNDTEDGSVSVTPFSRPKVVLPENVRQLLQRRFGFGRRAVERQ
jgi:probable HAF family extracellular repeat protein